MRMIVYSCDCQQILVIDWHQTQLKQDGNGGHVTTPNRKADHGSIVLKDYARSYTDVSTKHLFLLQLLQSQHPKSCPEHTHLFH